MWAQHVVPGQTVVMGMLHSEKGVIPCNGLTKTIQMSNHNKRLGRELKNLECLFSGALFGILSIIALFVISVFLFSKLTLETSNGKLFKT